MEQPEHQLLTILTKEKMFYSILIGKELIKFIEAGLQANYFFILPPSKEIYSKD